MTTTLAPETPSVFAPTFEGSEKKLEIVFGLKKNDSLRFLPRAFWASVVEASGAQILSELSNLEVDAYLLSESSLFVFRDRILMITCGRTRLAQAAVKVIGKLGIPQIESIFFERKNEAYPDAQYSSFDDDVAIFSNLFPEGTIEKIEYPSEESTPGGFIRLFHWGRSAPTPDQARTFELLMHDLDPKVLAALRDTSKTNRAHWSRTFHFNSVFPNFLIDEFWFEPCGYSLNGISGSEYFTIHITPEVQASYVSLESNRRFSSPAEFKRAIHTVLNVFKPKTSLLAQFTHESLEVYNIDWNHQQFQFSPAQSLALNPGVKFGFHAIERNLDAPISPGAILDRHKGKPLWANG